MWPLGNEEVLETNVTAHDVASYFIDGAFIIILVMVVLYWRWRRQQRRIELLEMTARRDRIAADV